MKTEISKLDQVRKIYGDLKKQGKKRITENDVIIQSLFYSGGTVCAQELPELFPVAKALEEADQAELEKRGEFYFSEKYNLTKQQVIENLTDNLNDLKRFLRKELSPGKIVGTGYKNPRKIAQEWLNSQITLNYYLLENFDKKNRLTETQKAEFSQ